VGGEGDNNFAGAAWVYARSSGVWSQLAKLVGTGAIGAALQGTSSVSVPAIAIAGSPRRRSLLEAADHPRRCAAVE
jgi:hypothetical protein